VALSATALLVGCRASVSPGVAVRTLPSLSNAAAARGATVTITNGATTPATPAPQPQPQPQSLRTVVTGRLAALARRLPPGAISLAVRNTRTGATYEWSAGHPMWTGSVYKLLVLEALLLERPGTSWLSSSEYADITAMIEQSDNRAGYRMYLAAGGSTGLAAACRKLGLWHTGIGRADPALTTMTAHDGVRLLTNLVSTGPLSRRSRAFVLGLMRHVQADQRWGVGIVADRGMSFANKNGWMDVDGDNDLGEDDGYLWLVDSLGVVRVHGEPLVLAVFTRHNPDFVTGVRLVQRLARLVAPVVS
jgi:beta-lactamase class A